MNLVENLIGTVSSYTTPLTSFTAVRDQIKEAAFKFNILHISSGSVFSEVFSVGDDVIKFGTIEDGWSPYIQWAQHNTSLYAPKLIHFEWITQYLYCAIMKKYTPIQYPHLGDRQPIIDYPWFFPLYREVEHEGMLCPYKDEEEQIIVKEEVNKDYPGLLDFGRMIREEFGMLYRTDLHSGNVLYDEEKNVPIILDPLAYKLC